MTKVNLPKVVSYTLTVAVLTKYQREGVDFQFFGCLHHKKKQLKV